MNVAIIYNACLFIGTCLVGAGVAMISVPAALIVVGALIIGMTFAVAILGRKA